MERIIHWLDKYFKGLAIFGPVNAPSSGMQITVAGDVGPEASGTRNFGATALRWAFGWFSTGLSVGVNSSGGTGLIHTTSNAAADHLTSELGTNTAASSARQRFLRARTSVTAPSAVNASDFIGTTSWEAEAGAGYLSLIRMIGYVVSRAASNDASGNLSFELRPAGAGAAFRGVFELQGNGSVVVGTQAGALATTAVNGFLYIPSCAGVPTGVPTAITGCVPMVYDTTNNRLYIYSGGAWRIH